MENLTRILRPLEHDLYLSGGSVAVAIEDGHVAIDDGGVAPLHDHHPLSLRHEGQRRRGEVEPHTAHDDQRNEADNLSPPADLHSRLLTLTGVKHHHDTRRDASRSRSCIVSPK